MKTLTTVKDLLVCLEPLLRGLGHADPGSLVQALQVLNMIIMTMMIMMILTTVMIRSLRTATMEIFLMIMIMKSLK